MKQHHVRYLLGILAMGMVLSQSMHAEEYWRDYFHLTTKDTFDQGPQMYGALTSQEAKQLDTYTLLRKMNAFMEDGEIPLSKVIYHYGEDTTPLSVAYYSYNFFSGEWKIQYLKEYSGANYRVFDYREPQENRSVEREL